MKSRINGKVNNFLNIISSARNHGRVKQNERGTDETKGPRKNAQNWRKKSKEYKKRQTTCTRTKNEMKIGSRIWTRSRGEGGSPELLVA